MRADRVEERAFPRARLAHQPDGERRPRTLTSFISYYRQELLGAEPAKGVLLFAEPLDLGGGQRGRIHFYNFVLLL